MMSKEQDFFKRQIEAVWPFSRPPVITCPPIKVKRSGSVVINETIAIKWRCRDYCIVNLRTKQSRLGAYKRELELIARAIGMYAEYLARTGLAEIVVTE